MRTSRELARSGVPNTAAGPGVGHRKTGDAGLRWAWGRTATRSIDVRWSTRSKQEMILRSDIGYLGHRRASNNAESTTPPYVARGCHPLARGGRSLAVFSPATAVSDPVWAVEPRSGSPFRTPGHVDRRPRHPNDWWLGWTSPDTPLDVRCVNGVLPAILRFSVGCADCDAPRGRGLRLSRSLGRYRISRVW